MLAASGLKATMTSHIGDHTVSSMMITRFLVPSMRKALIAVRQLSCKMDVFLLDTSDVQECILKHILVLSRAWKPTQDLYRAVECCLPKKPSRNIPKQDEPR